MYRAVCLNMDKSCMINFNLLRNLCAKSFAKSCDFADKNLEKNTKKCSLKGPYFANLQVYNFVQWSLFC